MVAIQNWNSYMNSLNSAVTFASSIISLTLPGIVQDFYPEPADNVTPLKTIFRMFNTVLGVMPFTGPVSTAASAISGGLNFLNNQIQPPEEPDRFLAWSNIANSMATVVEDYQSAVSNSIQKTNDAPVDDATSGINSVIAGGTFLGISQNFTQADLQKTVTDSITINAISLALQAQKIFVLRFFNLQLCNEDEATLCRPNESGGTFTQWTLLRRGSNANASLSLTQQKS